MIPMLSLWQIEKLTQLQSQNYTYRSHCTRTKAPVWLSHVTSVQLDSLERGSETSDRSRFKLITMVGRGGSRGRSFANILSLSFSVYQMFQ